jgi:hypothetical protein
MVEGKTHYPGTKSLDLYRYFMQSVDRAYFRAFPGNIKEQHRSNTYNSNHLTRKEFMENPELFYKNLIEHQSFRQPVEMAPGGTWSGEYALTGDIERTVEGTLQLVVEVRILTF